MVNTTTRNLAVESAKNTVKTVSSLSYRNNIIVDVPSSENILIRSNVTKNKLHPLLSQTSNNTGNHSMVNQNMKTIFTNVSGDKSHHGLWNVINRTIFRNENSTTARAIFYSKDVKVEAP